MYELTKKKTTLLREAGYIVIGEWECNFKRKLATDPELQAIVNDLSWISRLDPKEALFGARTGISCCYYKTKEDETVDYIDFTSLYPDINKYGTYPIGHPTILKSPSNQDIQSYFGIAKVDIIAPEKLFHPVLTMKIAEKYMFTLCAACVQVQLDLPWHQCTNMCNHTDQQRTMTGTWSTPELQKAIEKGYKVLKFMRSGTGMRT